MSGRLILEILNVTVKLLWERSVVRSASGFGGAFKVTGLRSSQAHPTRISNPAEASTPGAFLNNHRATSIPILIRLIRARIQTNELEQHDVG